MKIDRETREITRKGPDILAYFAGKICGEPAEDRNGNIFFG
jgi:hypothetical protein